MCRFLVFASFPSVWFGLPFVVVHTRNKNKIISFVLFFFFFLSPRFVLDPLPALPSFVLWRGIVAMDAWMLISKVSNLNRQFLFREHNVGQAKSAAAAIAAKAMNSSIKVSFQATSSHSGADACVACWWCVCHSGVAEERDNGASRSLLAFEEGVSWQFVARGVLLCRRFD